MTKKQQRIIHHLAATALLMLTACTEISELQHKIANDTPLCMTASGSTAADGGTAAVTRAADNLYTAATGFGGTEQVQVYLYSSGATYDATYDVGVPYDATIDGTPVKMSNLTLATGQTPLYYPYGSYGTAWLYGVYPHTSTATHTVGYDQTTDGSYKASDLMYAKTTTQWSTTEEKRSQTPNLEFHHQLVKLRLTIVKSKDVKQLTEVRMKNVRRTVGVTPATDAMTLGTPTTAADGQGDEIVISSGETASNDEQTYTYCCVFPAQPWNDGSGQATDFITLSADGGTATYRLLRDTWQQGYEYTLTLSLNPYMLGLTATISDWTDNQFTCTVNPTEAVGGMLSVGSVADQDYTGSPITPSPLPTVTDKDGNTLTKDTHYTLNIYNNTNVGTAIIVAVGKETYDGQVGIGSFNILSKSLSGGYITDIPDEVYNGAEHTPTNFIVYDANGKPLSSATDYDVTYENNVNAGTATVTITAKAGGNYNTGEQLTKTFQILPRSLTTYVNDFTITLRPALFHYTGSEQSTTVESVVDKGLATGTHYTMVTPKDYTVGGITKATEAGEYTVIVSGTGNYTGEKTVAWNISKYKITVKANEQTVTYGTPITQDASQVTVTPSLPDGITLDDITLAQPYADAGTYPEGIVPFSAVIKKGSNDITSQYDIAYESGKLTILKKEVDDWTIDPTEMTIGKNGTGTITVSYGSGSEGDHGTIVFTSATTSTATVDNKGIVTGVTLGTCTVTVTIGEGRNYYYTGSRSCNVNVRRTGVPLADSEVGMKVSSDGFAYPVEENLSDDELVGVVAYKNGSHGIVITSKEDPTMYNYYWSEACAYKQEAGNFYIADESDQRLMYWIVGTMEQYKNCGVGDNLRYLNKLIADAGGSTMTSGYWSTTTYSGYVYNKTYHDYDYAWLFNNSGWNHYHLKNGHAQIRKIFVF